MNENGDLDAQDRAGPSLSQAARPESLVRARSGLVGASVEVRSSLVSGVLKAGPGPS